jgi:hypothetical protein
MNPGARSSIPIEKEVLKATRNQYDQRSYHNAFENQNSRNEQRAAQMWKTASGRRHLNL